MNARNVSANDTDLQARRMEAIAMIAGGAALSLFGLFRQSFAGGIACVVGVLIAHRGLEDSKAVEQALSIERGRMRARAELETRPDMPDIDIVDEAGYESFPASDPPSYAGR
jgi:uncharacterized membrane protein